MDTNFQFHVIYVNFILLMLICFMFLIKLLIIMVSRFKRKFVKLFNKMKK